MTGYVMLLIGALLLVAAVVTEYEARHAFLALGIWAVLGGACYLT